MVRSPLLLVTTALAASIALGASGCTATDPKDADARASAVEVLRTADVGDVLVDGKGSVLYVFAPDDAEAVSCTFTCATNWPPFTASSEGAADAGDGVDASLLGTIDNPSGGKVITYNGWPLYRYAADKEPGEHKGQDRYLNGGEWFVMDPSGSPQRG